MIHSSPLISIQIFKFFYFRVYLFIFGTIFKNTKQNIPKCFLVSLGIPNTKPT